MTSFIEKAMVGYSIVGQSLELKASAGEAIVLILTDQAEEEICAGLFYQFHGRQPTEGEEFRSDVQTRMHYEKLKNFTRARMQLILNEAASEDRRLEREEAIRQAEARKNEFMALQQKLQNSNKPHPMGTVEELAKRFNVSKSEIRRRKAAGTLNELEHL